MSTVIKKIVIVDDEGVPHTTKQLRRKGYEVIEYSKIKEAIDYIFENPFSIDLIIIDYDFKIWDKEETIKNGVDLAKYLYDKIDFLPIVLFSGNPEIEDGPFTKNLHKLGCFINWEDKKDFTHLVIENEYKDFQQLIHKHAVRKQRKHDLIKDLFYSLNESQFEELFNIVYSGDNLVGQNFYFGDKSMTTEEIFIGYLKYKDIEEQDVIKVTFKDFLNLTPIDKISEVHFTNNLFKKGSPLFEKLTHYQNDYINYSKLKKKINKKAFLFLMRLVSINNDIGIDKQIVINQNKILDVTYSGNSPSETIFINKMAARRVAIAFSMIKKNQKTQIYHKLYLQNISSLFTLAHTSSYQWVEGKKIEKELIFQNIHEQELESNNKKDRKLIHTEIREGALTNKVMGQSLGLKVKKEINRSWDQLIDYEIPKSLYEERGFSEDFCIIIDDFIKLLKKFDELQDELIKQEIIAKSQIRLTDPDISDFESEINRYISLTKNNKSLDAFKSIFSEFLIKNYSYDLRLFIFNLFIND